MSGKKTGIARAVATVLALSALLLSRWGLFARNVHACDQCRRRAINRAC